MKRFVAVLSGLLTLPAFAEVAPVYYDDVIEYAEEEMPTEEVAEKTTRVVQPVSQPSNVSSRSGVNGRAASRVSPSARGTTNTSARSVNARTSSASRNATQARTGVQTRAVNARTASSRAANANNSRVAQRNARAATNTSTATASRRGVATGGAKTARAAITQTDTVNAPLYTGRVSTRSSAVMARAPVVSAINSTTSTTATTDTASTINQIDELAQMTDYCKAQYTSCMDNYCNVLDDNQGRCTCSKNIKNYEKTEKALKEATESLQDVAQQIQYIGLTGDDIETLFTQTEAEIQMQATTDNTQLKNSLDSIRDLIVDVKTGTATSSETGLSFDLSGLLDFNISGTGFDLGAMFGTNTANTSSISNQRGEQLYKTASARCKASVLNTCQNQGVDISVITNAYDMEIDKQCIAYERSLNEANDNMTATVRNAKTVLQKARLMVSQQKNAYDLRGCVNALDSCMQDEFVCGTDYENCLDPTGKYIVNGEIVAGSMPGLAVTDTPMDAPLSDLTQSGLYKTWNYDEGKINAWYGDGSLGDYINATVKNAQSASISSTMSEYLLAKIGYISDGRSYGMCSSVLNKCQMYTFDKNGNYQHDNMVVKEYLARTMTQIKAAQDEILADYAGGCMIDVETCLGKNNYGTNNGTYSNAAINACRSQIVTCMSVNGDATAEPNPAAIKAWIDKAYNETAQNCESTGGKWSNGKCTCKPGATLDTEGKCVGTPSEPENEGETDVPSGTENCVMIELIGKDNNVNAVVYKDVDKVNSFYSSNSCEGETVSLLAGSELSNYTFNGYYTKSDFSGAQCVNPSGTYMSITECSPQSDTKWYAEYLK